MYSSHFLLCKELKATGICNQVCSKVCVPLDQLRAMTISEFLPSYGGGCIRQGIHRGTKIALLSVLSLAFFFKNYTIN